MPTSPSLTPPPLSRRSFLKTSATLAAGAAILPSATRAHAGNPGAPLMAYVGTYSSPLPIVRPGQVDSPRGNGRGIHLFRVDRGTGALSPEGVLESTTTPNCLVLNAASTCLYSSNATEGLQEFAPGSVSAHSIDRADGHLTLLNTVSSGGAGPAYVGLHPSGRFLLVANYFGGSVAVLPILPDGKLGAATDFKQDVGTVGPKKATNAPPGSFAISGHEGPHAHMIQADASGRFVFSVEMGFDQILSWKFDDRAGTLSPNEPASVALPPGDGPRHLAFHPNGRWCYSFQEEASTVVLFDYDSAQGRLTPRQTLSSLPPGFAGTSSGSGILVSPDGRFVYAANRLHDSISCLAIGEDGTMTFAGEEWTRGDFPRTFNFDLTGNLLYSCNQRGDAITTFRIDRKSGALAFTGQYTPVGNPAAIVFVDLEQRTT